MKRIIKGLFVLLVVLTLSTSCIKRDDMENINIYTTIYTINYIIERLYGNYSTISSIYPNGVDVDKGIENTMDFETYNEILLDFCNTFPEEVNKFNQFKQQGDINSIY